MDDKTTLDDSSPTSVTRDLSERLGAVAKDVARIAELQSQLFAADLREAGSGAARAGLTAVIGYLLLASALPLLFAGLGLWLATLADISVAAGLLWVGLIVLLFALAAFGFTWLQIRVPSGRFERSRRELIENLHALGRVLSRQPGASQ